MFGSGYFMVKKMYGPALFALRGAGWAGGGSNL